MNHSSIPSAVPADACNAAKIAERIRGIEQGLINNTLAVLVVEATSRCNLTCSFCGMHSKSLSTTDNSKNRKMTPPKMHIDLDLFKETVKKCQGIGKLKVLYLHGNGEPLLNPDIVKMVDIAKKADIAEQIILVTNGVLLSKQVFMDLVVAGITSIRVSLDIISPKKFREVKGADFAEIVLTNIDACINLMRSDHLPVTLTVLCADPKSEDKEIVEETLKIQEYFEEKINDMANVIIQYRKLFNWVDSIKRITDGGPYRRPVPCEQPFYLLMVHADGDVSMCCADAMKELIVGNIQQSDSIKSILMSSGLKARQRNLLKMNYNGILACECCEVYSIVDKSLFEKREELLKLLLI